MVGAVVAGSKNPGTRVDRRRIDILIYFRSREKKIGDDLIGLILR